MIQKLFLSFRLCNLEISFSF